MDDENPTIHLAAGGQSITITLHGPYGSMLDEQQAIVIVRSGAFHGELAAIVWTYDLDALHQLLVTLDRMVGQPDRREWHSMENDLTLTFELSQVGHVLVHVEVLERLGDWSLPTTLSFTIRADQTYLPIWIRQVAHTLEAVTPRPRMSLYTPSEHGGHASFRHRQRRGRDPRLLGKIIAPGPSFSQ